MYCSRCFLRALALVVLTKSLYCAAVESRFDVRQEAIEDSRIVVDDRSRTPPVPSLPTGEDCADTGCLCQGFVHAPLVSIPQPEMSADQTLAQPAVFSGRFGIAWLVRIDWLWHLDDFPDRHRSGRAQRLWFGSLTI